MDQITVVDMPLRLASKKLLEQLEANGFQVNEAFWAKPSEGQAWQFYLSSPHADQYGPIASYRLLNTVLKQSPETMFDIGNIQILETDHPMAASVREKLQPRIAPGSFAVQRSAPFPGDSIYGSVELGGTVMDEAILFPLRHVAAVP